MRIGVIGLGSMGRPIGRNLAASGYAVSGYDISPSAMAAAASDGIEPAAGPAAMAEQCDLVLTMVWDDHALRSAVFGPEGLLEADDRLRRAPLISARRPSRLRERWDKRSPRVAGRSSMVRSSAAASPRSRPASRRIVLAGDRVATSATYRSSPLGTLRLRGIAGQREDSQDHQQFRGRRRDRRQRGGTVARSGHGPRPGGTRRLAAARDRARRASSRATWAAMSKKVSTARA